MLLKFFWTALELFCAAEHLWLRILTLLYAYFAVYDDYKFVTRTELEGLGLAHLVGSSMLRAYMHGYFMDVRLYHKVWPIRCCWLALFSSGGLVRTSLQQILWSYFVGEVSGNTIRLWRVQEK